MTPRKRREVTSPVGFPRWLRSASLPIFARLSSVDPPFRRSGLPEPILVFSRPFIFGRRTGWATVGIGFQAGITASTGNIGNHEQMPRLRGLGRALVHRNFRLFFFGQGISLVGTWMQQVATLWLVYQLTESPFLLGVVGFASQIPAALITPVAGVLTDRWNRRYTVFAAQALAMLHAFVLMGLTVTGWITIWPTVGNPRSIVGFGTMRNRRSQTATTEAVTRARKPCVVPSTPSDTTSSKRSSGPPTSSN